MPLSSPIFRRVLLGAFLLSAATLLALDFYLVRFTSQQHIESIQDRLKAEGRILSGELERVPAPQLQEWAAAAGTHVEARVTVINPQGVVLADSQQDPETMENTSGQPEVLAAFQGQVGTAVRASPTLHRNLCHLAMPIRYGGKTGFVLELALPLKSLKGTTGTVLKRILVVLLAATILALGIAYIFSRSFTRRINRLKYFAENLEKAPPSERALEGENDELGDLGHSLERAAARLRELLERLNLESAQRESILASMVEGVLAVDNQLRVTFCNDAFLRAVGATGPVRQRSPLLEIVRDPGLVDIVTHVLASKEMMRERLYFPVPEGRSFELHVSPLNTPSGSGAIVILHDVTDLERLERVRRDFVANVSHELRTPLTAIQGYAETLLEGGLEDAENNRKFVEIIRAHATRLSNIASDLLRLSELETDRATREPERISVRAAIETALRTIEPESHLRGIKVTCGPLEAPEIMAEKGRLEQVLVNLLDNAVKFNRPGGEVHVEVRQAPEGETHVVVSDTGIGIPSTDLSRIFERFYRVDKTRSREMGGTGLGLSIVKHIVDRMNGTVRVESQLGKGSTFTIVLPA
jgi:two-component system, OmpR family, phosphate regulon sensor histidine kinase PhoR